MTPRPATLRALLRRAHLGFALGAVALVGVVLAGPGLATLHVLATHNVHLVGRAIGYTLEAAVVFGDKDEADSELQTIAQTEDIVAATVTARDGTVLARWDAPEDGWRAALGQAVATLLFDGPVRLPILHDGGVVGHVEVWGGARMLLPFLAYGALGTVLCQLVAAAGALYVSNRIQRLIVQPLRTLADIAGTVQHDRAFGRRVPCSGIKELNTLGDSFNALLAELDTWHAGVTGENQRLSYQATHDSLTGLENRAGFEARLDRAMADARAAPGVVTVMLLDCNGFKQINDTHGHAAGDAVLAGIAARLRDHMRADDLVARLGGDEFAVLFAPNSPANVVDALVRTLDEAMRAPIPIMGGQAVTAGLSIGLARYPDDAAKMEALLHHADLAMYRDKQARRPSMKEL